MAEELEVVPSQTVIISANGSSTETKAEDLVVISRQETREGNPYALGKKRVAIVGFAPSSCLLAPFADPSWTLGNTETPSEIWGLNELYRVSGVSRADRWFDIHDRRDGDISVRDPLNLKFLREATIPIYMQEHFADIPRSLRYPREDVVRHFRTNYFTNTISYEIALAIMEGRDERGFIIDAERAFGEIRVYGVDMAQDAQAYSEYREQRPSCEYFLGWARAIGIKTYVPPQADLLKTSFMYGYEGDGHALKAKMNSRRDELQNQINALQTEANKLIQQAQGMQFKAAGLSGALEDTSYWDRCWVPSSPEPYTIREGKIAPLVQSSG